MWTANITGHGITYLNYYYLFDSRVEGQTVLSCLTRDVGGRLSRADAWAYISNPHPRQPASCFP